MMSSRFHEYLELTKPRVVALLVFCAVIGMFLAVPGIPPWRALVFGTLGIWMASGSAAAFNHLIDQRIDKVMARTAHRPLATGHLTPRQVLTFALVLGALSMVELVLLVNPLTALLTFGGLIGYAVIYTAYLKRATPQNIVIGGLAGAIPPVLGWTAVTGALHPFALQLCLIIFVWTPPHFWVLALYRRKDYENAGLPMLPVTHGEKFTRLHILLYTVILFAVTLMPFISGMSGAVYLTSAVLLGAVFLAYAWKIHRDYSDELARKAFRYSIVYLSLLFAALLVDHYARPLLGV